MQLTSSRCFFPLGRQEGPGNGPTGNTERASLGARFRGGATARRLLLGCRSGPRPQMTHLLSLGRQGEQFCPEQQTTHSGQRTGSLKKKKSLCFLVFSHWVFFFFLFTALLWLLMYPTIKLSFHLKGIIIITPVGHYHSLSSCWERKQSYPLVLTVTEEEDDGAQGQARGKAACQSRARRE